MDPSEQGVSEHNAPTEQHSQDRSDRQTLHRLPSQQSATPTQSLHVQQQRRALHAQHPSQHVPARQERHSSYENQRRAQYQMIQQQQQQHQQQQHQQLAQARTVQSQPPVESQQPYTQNPNLIMRMASTTHNVGPTQHETMTRTTPIANPVVASPTTTPIGSSSSTSKLWEHFLKGEKMQRTNKFLAHCIYCRKIHRDSSTRGERRMMSAHLSNCPQAPPEARAEGLAVSKELKMKRTLQNSGKKSKAQSVLSGSIGGIASPAVSKRGRRSSTSIQLGHAASSHDPLVAVATPTPSHATGTAGPSTGSQYFDPSMGPNLPISTDMYRSGHFTTNDNVRLYFEESGEGHPLILIHGLSGSCKFFNANFNHLAESFRVIRYDLRGHGDSEKPTHGFHVHRLAADLHDLIEHFSFHSVALLGCSLGCSIIWAFVEMYGVSQISAALFVDQSPYQMSSADGLWRLGSKKIFSEGSLTHVCSSLLSNPQAFHEGTVRSCFTRQPTDTETSILVRESLKSEVIFVSKLMTNHSLMDWRSVLPLVRCPALVIAGKKSKIFPWEGVKYAADNMPHAKLIPFEEGSHWLYIEEATRFNSTVVAFLQRIVSGA